MSSYAYLLVNTHPTERSWKRTAHLPVSTVHVLLLPAVEVCLNTSFVSVRSAQSWSLSTGWFGGVSCGVGDNSTAMGGNELVRLISQPLSVVLTCHLDHYLNNHTSREILSPPNRYGNRGLGDLLRSHSSRAHFLPALF